MGWLMRFSQMKLSELSTGQWTDLRYEINIFGDSFLPGPDRFPILPSYGLPASDWEDNIRCTDAEIPLFSQMLSRGERYPIPLPAPEIVEKLQNEAYAILDTFLREDMCALPLPRIQLNLRRFPDLDQPLTQLIVDRPQELFTYNISLLVCLHALRIRRCSECPRIFLTDRKNRLYCSVRCQTRVATRKYQGISEDRKGKRGRPPKKQHETQKVQPSQSKKKKRG